MSLIRSLKLEKLFSSTRLVFRSKHYLSTRCNKPPILRTFLQRTVTVSTSQKLKDKKISITFINRKGERIPVEAEENKTLLDIAKDNDLDLEGFGICDGTVSCSTCHVIFKEDDFDQVGRAKSDDEKDMLDMALGRTETSRLGCQVVLTKDLDGLVIKLPTTVTDAREL